MGLEISSCLVVSQYRQVICVHYGILLDQIAVATNATSGRPFETRLSWREVLEPGNAQA